jgi:hypothetical protein
LEIDARAANVFAGGLNTFKQRTEGGTGSALETSRAEAALANANSFFLSTMHQESVLEFQ